MQNKISYFNFLCRKTKFRVLLDYFRVDSTILCKFYATFEQRIISRGRIVPNNLRNMRNTTVYINKKCVTTFVNCNSVRKILASHSKRKTFFLFPPCKLNQLFISFITQIYRIVRFGVFLQRRFTNFYQKTIVFLRVSL